MVRLIAKSDARRKTYDQKTEIRKVSPLFAQARPEDWQAMQLGTFGTREAAAEKQEREIQYFKRNN